MCGCFPFWGVYAADLGEWIIDLLHIKPKELDDRKTGYDAEYKIMTHYYYICWYVIGWMLLIDDTVRYYL